MKPIPASIPAPCSMCLDRPIVAGDMIVVDPFSGGWCHAECQVPNADSTEDDR